MSQIREKLADWDKYFRAEEKFLALIFGVFFAVFLLFKPSGIGFTDFTHLQLTAFKNSFKWFFESVALLWAYFLCLYTTRFLVKNIYIRDPDALDGEVVKAKKFLAKSLRFLQFFVFLVVGFSGELLVLYIVTQSGHQRMVNELLMSWDKAVFGVQPFLWFHMVSNPLKPFLDAITLLIGTSFDKLSTIMGCSLVLLYNKKKIFAGLVISYFVAIIFGLVLWSIFPVNSPNNYYLSKNPQIEGYQPNKLVDDFQTNIREQQKDTLPISTFPSAHVMWGFETMFFWALYSRKTLFISVPWFILMSLGTVYLAQHWAVDILAAIPLAVFSIMISRLITRRVAQ
jgi:membrane-associated phospholipid phosphatase